MTNTEHERQELEVLNILVSATSTSLPVRQIQAATGMREQPLHAALHRLLLRGEVSRPMYQDSVSISEKGRRRQRGMTSKPVEQPPTVTDREREIADALNRIAEALERGTMSGDEVREALTPPRIAMVPGSQRLGSPGNAHLEFSKPDQSTPVDRATIFARYDLWRNAKTTVDKLDAAEQLFTVLFRVAGITRLR